MNGNPSSMRRRERKQFEAADVCERSKHFAGVESEDGQTVAFVSDRTGVPKLYLLNSDGTNTIPLDCRIRDILIDPSWAPNGATAGVQLAAADRQLRFVRDGRSDAADRGADARCGAE